MARKLSAGQKKKPIAIYSALAANVLISATKFVAGSLSNSSSMIAEGIHSLVDTSNQLLLLYGIKKSKRSPDLRRPFGYGKEIYFWSFLVSLVIFALGGGLTIYQGVIHILQPEATGDFVLNYVVLGFSFLFDGGAFLVSLSEFRKTKGDLPFWKAIIASKDPSGFLLVFEDAAAVIGLVVVFVLMLLNQVYNLPILDGVASVLVGLILVAASLILARESRSLLMGEGVSDVTRKRIRTIVENDPAVRRVNGIFSNYEAPDEILLMLVVTFSDRLHTAEITEAIKRVRRNIKSEFDKIEFVIVQPRSDESLPGALENIK